MIHSRYISIHGDIAWEVPKGPDHSELFYLTGESQDRFSMPSLSSAQNVQSVVRTDGLASCSSAKRRRGSDYSIFHDLRDFFFKGHPKTLGQPHSHQRG
jgi:hypothetical protein